VSPARDFTVEAADWRTHADALRHVRRVVFIDEQRVPENLEWDDEDVRSVHALARDAHGAPIGCGRLLQDGHIGRMAVVAPWRGRGVGDALLTWLMAAARARGDGAIVLNAQAHAMPFYARHGFVAIGEPFDEAGIVHRVMRLALR
jgi:predicted GNAT family N-acyltransferase